MSKHKTKTPIQKERSPSPERKAPIPESTLETQKKLNEMIVYIIQDAAEKAEEVDVRTEEEFNNLRHKIENISQLKIEKEYMDKEKKLQIENEIYNAHTSHKGKMDITETKQMWLKNIKELVAENIRSDMENKQRYANVLHLLVMEGLFQLMDTTIYIRCRPQDICMMSALIPICKYLYQRHTKYEVKMSIDNKCLPEDCLGGVELSTENDRIVLLNTLDLRLDQIIVQCVPAINAILFEKILHTTKL